jgi:hypothetical protein
MQPRLRLLREVHVKVNRERAAAAKQSTADKLATIAGELEDLAVELHHAFPICSSRCDWAAEHLRNAVSDLLGPKR